MHSRTLTRLLISVALLLAPASAALAQSHFPLPGAPVEQTPIAPFADERDQPNARPKLLLPLYVSAGALQAMDTFTTYRGMKAGAFETNPLVRNGNAATTVALKAATTGVGILVAEKMWKKNKAAAIAAMIATNVVTASVVANNYRVLNATRTK